MKYEHVIEASQDAKQMEDTSILGGDPLDGRPCETCQCYTLGCGEDCREGDDHDSDCSTHNAPAYPAGDCNCSASLVKRLRKISADNKGPRDCIDEAADEIEKRNRNRNAVIEQCAVICEANGARISASEIRAMKLQPVAPDKRDEALRLSRVALEAARDFSGSGFIASDCCKALAAIEAAQKAGA